MLALQATELGQNKLGLDPKKIKFYGKKNEDDPKFSEAVQYNLSAGYIRLLTLPCGQCIGCRLERSRQWALRCVHESEFHQQNCFLTLTYDPEHLPKNGSLNVRDIQLFLKKLRKAIEPDKVRFFQCGEYGSNFDRPHHHMILFGYDFPDKELFFKSVNGQKVYRSRMLEKLWIHGFSSIGDVSFESAAYVARYCLKKVTGDEAEDYYGDRKPEYVTMSRRPGIAADWITKYMTDVYPKDFLTIRDGVRCKPAKFYDRIFEKNHGEKALKLLKKKREYEASRSVDNSLARLKAKEVVKEAATKSLIRNMEY